MKNFQKNFEEYKTVRKESHLEIVKLILKE